MKIKEEVKNPIEERRFGRFRISFELLKDKYPDMALLFRNLIVLKAEDDFASNSVMYTVAGEVFEPIEDGRIPPEYEVVISTKKGIEFIREEEKSLRKKRRLLECKW